MMAIEEFKMEYSPLSTISESLDDTHIFSHYKFLERYTILATQEMIVARKCSTPAKESCAILIDSISANILHHMDDPDNSFELGSVNVIITGDTYNKLENYRANLLNETAIVARRFLDIQNTERVLVAVVRLQCFARKFIAIQRSTKIRKAAVAIQSCWRGWILRNEYVGILRNYSSGDLPCYEDYHVEELQRNVKALEEETDKLKSLMDILATPRDQVAIKLTEMINSMKIEHREDRRKWDSERKALVHSICCLQNQMADTEKEQQEAQIRFNSLEDKIECLGRSTEGRNNLIPSVFGADLSHNSERNDDFSKEKSGHLERQSSECSIYDGTRTVATMFTSTDQSNSHCPKFLRWKHRPNDEDRKIPCIFCFGRKNYEDD